MVARKRFRPFVVVKKVSQSGKLQIGALRERPQRFPMILTNSALESHGQGLSNAPRVGIIGLR